MFETPTHGSSPTRERAPSSVSVLAICTVTGAEIIRLAHGFLLAEL